MGICRAYTVTTAGEEGFFNILPVYLNHVLYPYVLYFPVIYRSVQPMPFWLPSGPSPMKVSPPKYVKS